MNMMQIMEQIFGTYTLVDGHPNWQYIGGVIIFAIVLWSAFTILGLVFKK